MWSDRLKNGKNRGSRGRASVSRRRPLFVVNTRLKDKKAGWGPQLGKVLLVLLVIGLGLFLATLGLRGIKKSMFTENRAYSMTNLVVVCKENPALAYRVFNEESGLKGTNLFCIAIESLQVRLARTPWIKTVTVNRQLPHTLEIRISERRPVARLGHPRDDAQHFVVDDEGVVFPRVRNLPMITGYAVTRIIPGERIRKEIKDALTSVSYTHLTLPTIYSV